MKAGLLMLVLGIVLGVAGTILLPRFLGPMLPAGLRPEGESVEGTVVRRLRDENRLLLTINTPQGAALATFTEKVAEIDLLVEEGDAVTLGLGAYEPFVDNPPIRAVRKADPTGSPALPGLQDPAGEARDPALPAVDEPVEEVPEAELEEWPGDGEEPPGE